MRAKHSSMVVLLSTVLLLIAFTAATTQPATPTPMAQVTNPCAAKAANPCHPCAAKNPCAAGSTIDPQLVTRPAGTQLFNAADAELVTFGKQLWQDRALGASGLACQTCHLNNANFNPTFVKPYPHMVAMPPQRAGGPAGRRRHDVRTMSDAPPPSTIPLRRTGDYAV